MIRKCSALYVGGGNIEHSSAPHKIMKYILGRHFKILKYMFTGDHTKSCSVLHHF